MAPPAWKPILPLSKGSKTYSASPFRNSQRPADPPSRPKFDEQREPFCKIDKMDMDQNAWTPRIGWFSTQTIQFADSAVRTVWAMRNSAGLPWEIPIPPIAGLPHSRPFVKIHTSSPAAALTVLDLQRETLVWTYAYLNIVYYWIPAISSSDLNRDPNEKVHGVPKGSDVGGTGVSKRVIWGTNKSSSLFIMPTSASRHKCQIQKSKKWQTLERLKWMDR